MDNLLRDLWVFLFDSDIDLRFFVRDIYDLSRDLHENHDYVMVCYFAVSISQRLGGPLPSHIHNRLLLGPSNEHVKRYIEINRSLHVA